MRLFLDTADSSQWRLPAGCPRVCGVTTNPSLVHQAGRSVTLETYLDLIARAADQGVPALMLQLPRPDVSEALAWTQRLIAASQKGPVDLTIKLPCRPDWLSVLRAVQREGVTTLFTGVSNPMQLLWARECEVTYIAPYIGRLQADGREIWTFVEACVKQQVEGGPRLLAASIKSSDVLSRLIAVGAFAVTVRPEFAAGLATDPLTQSAIAQFDSDTAASHDRQSK